MRETAVRIPLSDLELNGYLLRPEASGDVPAVALLHGWGPPTSHGAEALRESAEWIAARGWAALALSMRGWPDTGGEDDCGARQPEDTLAAIEWLAAQPAVDAQRIALMGFSQGGQVALLTAALGASLRAVVAYYPVTDIERWGETSSHPAVRRWYVPDVCSIGVGPGPRSPRTLAGRIETPVRLVHGDADTRVPTEQSVLMDAALREAGKRVELRLVSGQEHGKESWDLEVWRTEWDLTCEFLEREFRNV